ncbi:MAG: hypothetical protein E7028_10935 [Planctomycetaceae bacterium]|nr:hypothetical protein [Planctomycetaceae bacterium]
MAFIHRNRRQSRRQLPTPGGDPADKVGFARKAKNGTSDSAKPTNIPHAGKVRKLSDKEWKRYGIDPHDFEPQYTDDPRFYNIAVDTKTGEIILTPVRPGSLGNIHTGEFLR